jgi:hypothetical protein
MKENQKDKKMRSFLLSNETVHKINYLAKEKNSKKMEIIEQTISEAYKIHYLCKIWQFGLADEITILLSDFGGRSDIPEEKTEYQKYANPKREGSVLAIGAIAPNIALANKSKELDIYMHTFPINWHGNLICLGGPKSNKVTKYFLTETHLKHKCIFNNETLFINKETEHVTVNDTEILDKCTKYEAVFDKDEKHILQDYGILLKTCNPLNRANTIMIIAGCRAFGTGGAARVIADDEKTHKLMEKLGDDCKHFLAVVFVNIINDVVVDIDIIEVEPLNNMS